MIEFNWTIYIKTFSGLFQVGLDDLVTHSKLLALIKGTY